MVQIERNEVEARVAASLLREGRLDEAKLDRARRVQAESGERLIEILVKLGLAAEQEVTRALAAELDLPVAAAGSFPETPVFAAEISEKYLRHARLLPLAEEADHIVLAMADPLDGEAIQAMETALGRPMRIRVAANSDLETAWDRLFSGGRSQLGQIVSEIETDTDEGATDDVNRLRDLASEGPVIRLVNLLIAQGVESRASDIHIEPFQNRLAVRYRIDGHLQDVPGPPTRLRAAVVSRIKIMAKLNIAERRLPQDGRIRAVIRGREYDLRVATVPTLYGEAVTMRILDRGALVHDFEQLGFAPDTLQRFFEVLAQPQGIVLVTGPTGSGKTTTLYTSLMRLNQRSRKLFTVEEPIEYQLEGVNQVQVNPQIGLTFAQVLRTLLRHNPDIIMIGEMRDLETAQIAIQAALTGHLVLSTLHTNSAASSITRLLDMKVEDYLVTSTLNAVIAQRLVRKLCPHCREPFEALPELARQLRLPEGPDGAPFLLYRAKGCEHCQGSGYFGQTALIELLVMSETTRRLVLRHAEAREIHLAAIREGMRPMYEEGLRQACAGTTTLEEVLRVTRDL